MIFILTGCFAFAFFFFFDLNNYFSLNKKLNFFFAIGVVLLCFSTVCILFSSHLQFNLPLSLRLLFGVLSAVSLLLIIYTLFFALPFRKTYCRSEDIDKVIDTGMYALCRHPGVIWFFFFYFFLWMASGKTIMLRAAVIWTIMDIIYVYVQDRWIFPKTLNGYELYKERAPFLIPNLSSIRKCISALK